MTKYREIIRLDSLELSKRRIAESVPCARNTAASVVDRAHELNLKWPLPQNITDSDLGKMLFQKESEIVSDRRMPDFAYIRKELHRNGVTKKLLWKEYLEDCCAASDKPLMYGSVQAVLHRQVCPPA